MDIIREVVNEFRYGEFELNSEVEEGRHYSSKEVAAPITDLNGICLAWTYYFGGGKWGEPEAMEWMDNCYLVREKEETRIVKVYERVEE